MYILNTKSLAVSTLILSIFITYIGYSIANGIFAHNILLGFSIASLDLIQSVSSAVIFLIIGKVLEKLNLREKLN